MESVHLFEIGMIIREFSTTVEAADKLSKAEKVFGRTPTSFLLQPYVKLAIYLSYDIERRLKKAVGPETMNDIRGSDEWKMLNLCHVIRHSFLTHAYESDESILAGTFVGTMASYTDDSILPRIAFFPNYIHPDIDQEKRDLWFASVTEYYKKYISETLQAPNVMMRQLSDNYSHRNPQKFSQMIRSIGAYSPRIEDVCEAVIAITDVITMSVQRSQGT